MVIPQVVQPKIERKTIEYNQFKGVDFSTDASLVDRNRSPYAPNMISDLGGMPEKRPGWRIIHSINSDYNVNGLYTCEIGGTRYNLAHVGNAIYKWDGTNYTQLKTGIANKKSTAVFFRENDADNGKLYIFTGEEFLYFDGINIADVSSIAYTPTILISRLPTGGGTLYEPVNLLSAARTESFLGDNSSTDYQLSSTNITAVTKIEYLNSSGNKVTMSTSEYSVNTTDGVVTFNSAHEPIVAGQDNIFITYTKTVTGYADRINKCSIATMYGAGGNNRLFVSGNSQQKMQNYDWWSEVFKPNYFPDVNYSVVGSDDTRIMGYQKLGKQLIVVKEDNQQDTTIFARSWYLNDDGEPIFTLEQGISGLGAISTKSFATLIDEPLMLTRQGIYAITTATLSSERTIRDRSYFVNTQLIKEPNLSEACACEWNGYYLLAVNSHVYILDSKKRAFQSNKNNISTTYDFLYECYYWTNIPATCWLSSGNDLYFGTNDGKICKFNTDIEDMTKYNDNGEKITCMWSTCNDDDGALYLYKTMQKKGCLCSIKPFTRSSAEVYICADGNPERFIKRETMDILDFSDIDFERFTFNTNSSPQEIFFKKKIKKYKRLQIIIKNDALNEGFGIFKIIKTYSIGNYAKK